VSTTAHPAHLLTRCRITFYALVDADPHGIDILSVYTYGSKATTYSHDHAGLALGDRLKWLGVKASDWLR